MMISFKWSSFAAILFVMSGCINTADQYYGSGPITISKAVERQYQRYLTQYNGEAFAVTEDGSRSFFIHCAHINCVVENEARLAIEMCQERWGKKCYLYAYGKNVVWKKASDQFSDAMTAIINESEKQVLCRTAIQSDQPKWEKASGFQSEVNEAKRRGLTEHQCASLTGRFEDIQIANIRSESNETVCNTAIAHGNLIWSSDLSTQKWVVEAKRRGLSERQCARLAGRHTEEQIHKYKSVVSPPNIGSSAKPDFNVEQQLLTVKDLLKKGLITSTEAEQKRKEILGRL